MKCDCDICGAIQIKIDELENHLGIINASIQQEVELADGNERLPYHSIKAYAEEGIEIRKRIIDHKRLLKSLTRQAGDSD